MIYLNFKIVEGIIHDEHFVDGKIPNKTLAVGKNSRRRRFVGKFMMVSCLLRIFWAMMFTGNISDDGMIVGNYILQDFSMTKCLSQIFPTKFSSGTIIKKFFIEFSDGRFFDNAVSVN